MIIIAVLFLAGAVFHAVALYYGANITIGDWVVPTWVRLLGIFVAFVLALESVRYMK